MDKRFLDQFGEFRAAFDGLASGLCTAIPGVIVGWDAATNLASVQPAIRMKVVASGGAVQYVDLPVIESVPICLPGSVTGGLHLTVPIKSGDACLIVFSQRGLDNWLVAGGLQNPPDGSAPANCALRHHDLTDAICIPGLRALPAALPNWSATAAELRRADGTVAVSVSPTAIVLRFGAVTITMNADGIAIVGNVQITGTLQASGQITSGVIPLSTHEHPQSGSKPGFTGGPTPP